MRILGLDVGEKRIGIACSDALLLTAQGLESYLRTNTDSDYKHIVEIICERQVHEIVIGLPVNMNGTHGPATEKAKAFGEALAKFTDVPIAYYDERLTTVSAHKTLLEADMSRQKRRKVVDKLAATFILQGYLDFTACKR